jgi:CubicO group peptidase (beta-lactamase class C family)
MTRLTVLLILLPLLSISQKNYNALFDKYMDAQVHTNDFSGSVLVAQKGKIIYEKAFGMGDREWNAPNTVKTRFELGSITKQFTASCILQLAENGKLSLDDKLSKYFPGYPKGDSVTIHMLLTHTSGISSYTSLPNFMSLSTLSLSKDSMISYFRDKPYDFSPGTKWNYSNSGYFLLGYIIEKVSGQSYRDYLYEHVIKKAGLHNTDANRWDTILPFRARGYSKNGLNYRNATFISMEWPYSAGMLYSTVEDVYQWDKALHSGKIISPGMLVKMKTVYMNHYGYGLFIDSLKNHLRINHGGGIPGFITANDYFPNDDAVVIVLSNNESNSGEISAALASTLFDLPVTFPSRPKAVQIKPEVLQKYIGKYKLNEDFTFELYTKEKKLYAHTTNGDVEFIPESETRFFLASDPGQELLFEIDKKGSVTKIYALRGDSKMEIQKLQ